MMFKNSDLAFFYRSLVRRRRARVIDHPVLGPVGRDVRRAEQNHYVIRKLLHPRLIEEDEIAGLGFAPITGDKYAVEILQRTAVGKLGKPAVAEIAFMKRSKVSAKDFLAQRVLVEIKPGHVRRRGLVSWPHFLEPGPVVTTQRFADREPRQAGAIALFGVPL